MLKYNFFTVSLVMVILIIFTSCSNNSMVMSDIEVEQEVQTEVTDLPPGGGIMMQGFYWDVPGGGTWWNTVKGKISSWKSAGITAVWLPPSNKGQGGGYTMGYDPFDYYDFGNYNQQGNTETRFGSKTELQGLISRAHAYGMQVYADIVINHNSGGSSEYNPYAGKSTWTKFQPASGKFYRGYNDFHPNSYHNNDEGAFGGYPDLCHHKSYVQDWLWKRSDSVAKYYKNTMKYDGWRFDFVKGFGSWVVRDWVGYAGGFSVGELWDSNVSKLQTWVNGTWNRSSVFDFSLYYKMDQAFDGNNLYRLNDWTFTKQSPSKSVTFVANHDTDIIYNKMPAYAYILTHEGYPCIFYRDYENWLDKNKLNNLMWIHAYKAVGSTSVLYVDTDEYIAQRNGWPGLVVFINNSSSWKGRWVGTKYNSTTLHDYTGSASDQQTQSNGWVKLWAPPKGYAIYSPK